MNNIVSVKLDSRYASTLGVWQYDYGQVLRITGPELPPAVEVQFSLNEKSGETLSRVGTTVDGVTEVKIPDELLTHSATSNYRIYAYIYLTDETSGNTKYEITIPVRVRSKPTSPAEDPETDPDLFRETVAAVNASADRAKMAEQNAKESATEAGKYAASASGSAVTAEKTKEDALRKVGEKKRETIEAIQNQEETSIGKITTHTDGEIQRIQNQATDSKAGLEQTITNADASKKELEHSIETAGTSKTALDKSVELAGTAKTELDTSIREAGTAKTALDESTETAGTVQEDLSATVKQAGALDTSLGEKIETGIQLKTDLVASGEKAVQDIQAAGSEQLGKMQAVAEAFTADREQIAINKEDIGSLKEDISNKITKFYASNQGENHLADSDDGKIQDMMICGNSNQNQTKGKNLLKYPYIETTKTSLGITFTDNKDGSINVSGTGTETAYYNLYSNIDGKRLTLASGTYKLVAKGRSKCNVFINNGVTSAQNEGTFTITDGHNDVWCFIEAPKGLAVSETIYPMIQLASITDESYEPYTGGQPSPSPNYPQEIKRVVNPVVKVCGKNLLPPNLRNSDRVKINIKKGVKLTLICKNGVVSKGGNLKFKTANGGISWFGFDKGSVKQQITLYDDVVAYTYMFSEQSESYALYIGDENTYEPYKEQTVQLHHTLNAIPVASGGNVTIDGKQYIADYMDVERGKLVRMCKYKKLLSADIKDISNNKIMYVATDEIWDVEGNYTSRKFNILCSIGIASLLTVADGGWKGKGKIVINNVQFTHIDEAKNYFDNNDVYVCYPIPTPEENPITLEEVSAFKQLMTYYPVTNISVNSEQLDGYTVFNYPISMANGWNYVKQQLGDTRDYIYDMDAKAQDIDIQSAEAYVNSEYAVALTELEV